jgi:hypothetical protein
MTQPFCLVCGDSRLSSFNRNSKTTCKVCWAEEQEEKHKAELDARKMYERYIGMTFGTKGTQTEAPFNLKRYAREVEDAFEEIDGRQLAERLARERNERRMMELEEEIGRDRNTFMEGMLFLETRLRYQHIHSLRQQHPAL